MAVSAPGSWRSAACRRPRCSSLRSASVLDLSFVAADAACRPLERCRAGQPRLNDLDGALLAASLSLLGGYALEALGLAALSLGAAALVALPMLWICARRGVGPPRWRLREDRPRRLRSCYNRAESTPPKGPSMTRPARIGSPQSGLSRRKLSHQAGDRCGGRQHGRRRSGTRVCRPGPRPRRRDHPLGPVQPPVPAAGVRGSEPEPRGRDPRAGQAGRAARRARRARAGRAPDHGSCPEREQPGQSDAHGGNDLHGSVHRPRHHLRRRLAARQAAGSGGGDERAHALARPRLALRRRPCCRGAAVRRRGPREAESRERRPLRGHPETGRRRPASSPTRETTST